MFNVCDIQPLTSPAFGVGLRVDFAAERRRLKRRKTQDQELKKDALPRHPVRSGGRDGAHDRLRSQAFELQLHESLIGRRRTVNVVLGSVSTQAPKNR
jgi:hypothetical protein